MKINFFTNREKPKFYFDASAFQLFLRHNKKPMFFHWGFCHKWRQFSEKPVFLITHDTYDTKNIKTQHFETKNFRPIFFCLGPPSWKGHSLITKTSPWSPNIPCTYSSTRGNNGGLLVLVCIFIYFNLICNDLQ